MLDRATLRIFVLIVALYGILWLPVMVWPDSSYLDTGPGLVAAFPLLSIYIFHGVGIPGLLQNDGACGWSWCGPSVFGWVFLLAFWLALVWCWAKAVASFMRRAR